MDLKEKLAVLRTERGLTQGELASKINVSRQTVYKWEGGAAAPSAENLVALSRLYGIPADELLSDELSLEEKTAAAVAVEERPEAAIPCRKYSLLNIAGAAVLAACLLLMTVAAVITICSAIFKEPERLKGPIVINQDDLQWEDIDLDALTDDSEGRRTIP